MLLLSLLRLRTEVLLVFSRDNHTRNYTDHHSNHYTGYNNHSSTKLGGNLCPARKWSGRESQFCSRSMGSFKGNRIQYQTLKNRFLDFVLRRKVGYHSSQCGR